MIKRDFWKYLLFLLSFSILISCGTSSKIQIENWTHFYDPCINGEIVVVPETLHLIKQKQRNDCWFSCYAMLKSWKDQKPYTYQEVKENIGKWKVQIRRNTGLYVSEQPEFIKDKNLGFYPPANYFFEGFVDKLKKHGPLMICMSHKKFNHARILYKIECGSKKSETFFYLINPRGAKIEKWNAYKFFDAFENEAKKTVVENNDLSEEKQLINRKMRDAWRYQILYIK